ncbi:MAG: DUF2892 domain-containing protein [Paracoccaceae bacterium]
MLKKNMGNIDRIVRAIVGVAALAAFFMLPVGTILHWLFLLVGLIGVGTSLMSSCPVYSIAGMNTCALDDDES